MDNKMTERIEQIDAIAKCKKYVKVFGRTGNNYHITTCNPSNGEVTNEYRFEGDGFIPGDVRRYYNLVQITNKRNNSKPLNQENETRN